MTEENAALLVAPQVVDRSELVDFLRGVRRGLDFDGEPVAVDQGHDRPRRVALIEDNDIDARVTARLLERSAAGSFELTRFSTIAESTHHLRSRASEIVLLDLGLPDVRGNKVVEVVRELAPSTPIVILSGDNDEDRAIQSLHKGAQDYVVKGALDADLLARTIRHALARADAEHALRLAVVKLLARSDELASQIEHRTLIEAELRAEREQLSVLVGQLERAREVQTEFLATVSHELRTPLTSIIGYCDILTDAANEADPGLAASAAGVIDRNGKRLLALVNDLLITAECDTFHLRLRRTRVSLADVVATVVETVRPAIEKNDLDIRVEQLCADPLVWGDAGQLERALTNLVGNAVKFTPAGGSIEITVFEPEANKRGVWVRDNGPGIESADQERLFERFERGAQATSNQIQGTGLGLSIVRSIMDAHGGRVSVESEVGIGTTMTLILPVDRREEPDQSAGETSHHVTERGASQ